MKRVFDDFYKKSAFSEFSLDFKFLEGIIILIDDENKITFLNDVSTNQTLLFINNTILHNGKIEYLLNRIKNIEINESLKTIDKKDELTLKKQNQEFKEQILKLFDKDIFSSIFEISKTHSCLNSKSEPIPSIGLREYLDLTIYSDPKKNIFYLAQNNSYNIFLLVNDKIYFSGNCKILLFKLKNYFRELQEKKTHKDLKIKSDEKLEKPFFLHIN